LNAIGKQLMRTGNRLAVFLYRRSKGRIGGSAKGHPLLLLTVSGRTSGRPHTTAITYFEHDGSYVLAGSAGGAKHDPQWIKNLRSTATARIQVGAKERDVTARVARGEERDALWRDVVTAHAPFFARYEEKAGRIIPVAVLDPTPGSDSSH
jgi:deazaflavin-dependent oxidoreductase (nitroreductase family)